MKRFRRFGVLATNLQNNLFFKTRIRLTLFYIVIIAVILFIFSQILFLTFSRNIEQSAERYEVSERQEHLWISDAKSELGTILILANLGILVVTGGLSYFLAGKTLDPIQSALMQQHRFLSDASHELRTPISILKTNMEVELDSKKIRGEHKKNLESNLSEVNRMAKLVNDLLLLSRLDAGNPYGTFSSFRLSEVLANVVERMRVYAKTKSVSITHEPSGKDTLIRGNQDMFSSALLNIVKNAVDYNRRGGKVVIFQNIVSGECVIEVRDTGFGIPRNEISNVYERFFRIDKSRSSEEKSNGTGLGLAISRAVIREHGGTIRIKSQIGKGTKVIVSLPVEKTS